MPSGLDSHLLYADRECPGATGRIRTYGFRDLQSLALGHSATVALFDEASAYTPFNSVTTETKFGGEYWDRTSRAIGGGFTDHCITIDASSPKPSYPAENLIHTSQRGSKLFTHSLKCV